MTRCSSVPEPTLVILCKRPTLTEGKQRLAPALGAELTRRLAQALLNCALEDAAQWPGPVVISPARTEDRDWAANLPVGACVLPQGEGNLGARINRLDSQLRALGHQRLVYIGTDAPGLDSGHYSAVRRELARSPVVLSAAADGGVVLMASREPWPELEALPWSTATLGEALHACCLQGGLKVTYTAPGYDVDLVEDLPRLREDLSGDPRAARQRLLALLDVLPRPRVRSA
ncbi:DUF2064 domain-containing protein [Motiliproteus sp. SC1-56]|uniref:TIGR04282 family arsenosugar biosynthesis glycosyltransferase n=1 Tax=Motiliproteus sp. SC1-56 TaxID=2799565 RepID=UPI001A8C68EC|nr:DUF2064 domain-containing protein [Motiliproteus sp. SC1-56]